MRRLAPALIALVSTMLIGAPAAVATPGIVTHYPTASTTTTPYGIYTGPDGKIWFVDSGNHVGNVYVGRMSTTGAVGADDLIPLPHTTLGLAATLGPDGNMWVLQSDASQTGYVNKMPAPSRPTGTSATTSRPSPARSPASSRARAASSGSPLMTGSSA